MKRKELPVNPITAILHYKTDDSNAHPAVTPIYQCSAFTAESQYFYTRKNNPNVEEFEFVISTLERTSHAIAFATGMSAIYMVLDLLKPGNTLVINKHIYGCSYKLFQRICENKSLRLVILDLSVLDNIKLIPPQTNMVFFETPTNPFLKTIEINSVVQRLKSYQNNGLVVVDNTWATSLYQRPLEQGADISLHSCTKYYSGHSDVMGGVAVVNDNKLYNELLQNRFYAGTILMPYQAWLLRRSMQTFVLRMEKHTKVTLEMVEFLNQFSHIEKIYFPTVDGNQLTNYGGIIFIQLKNEFIDKYYIFRDALKLFGTGTGMACVTSMIAQPYTGSHASMTDIEKEEMNLDKGLIRLCFGLEDPNDLKDDLINAFRLLSSETNQPKELV